MPQMPQMIPGHPPMLHPMNPHPAMMMNKPPMNMQMMPRPFMNVRKQDGKIDVIGRINSMEYVSNKCLYLKVRLIKHLVDKCLMDPIRSNIHHL